MHSVFPFFSETDNPVLSYEVQAKAAKKEVERMNRFAVLVTHFFVRLFDNPLTSLDGENSARVIQILAAIAVPGLIFSLSLIPSYFQFPPPLPAPPRAFWPRVSDHYFFVMYTAVATGAATVFEWDMLFPDKIDILVLTPLPVQARKFFAAKITSLIAFLGLFLAASSILGTIFLTAIAGEPSFFRHVAAHGIAVTASGIFTAAFFIATQGILLNIFGERIFSWMSSTLQGLALTALLIVLFLFPLLSGNLRILLSSGGHGIQYFPLFWFLGIYQVLLQGSSALPIFHILAIKGCLALFAVIALACATYPLAYRRRTRSLIEGFTAKNGRDWLTEIKNVFLHFTILRRPSQRAIYHFISQTLKRASQHRVYLSMYAGIGLALILSSAVAFKLGNGEVRVVLSEKGLHVAVPLAAFWLVMGFKSAFMVPFELAANWPFHVIGIRPDAEHVATTQRWTLLPSLVVATALAFLGILAHPSSLGSFRTIAAQLLLAQGICLLLVDGFFLRFLDVPFAAPLAYSKRNVAFALAAFLFLFPAYIQIAVAIEGWMEQSLRNTAIAALCIAIAHIGFQFRQRKIIMERASLPQGVDTEEFPQRLGLS